MESGNFAISSEGLSILFNIDRVLVIKAMAVALIIGVFSGVYPAILSIKGRLADKLRSV